MDYITHTLFGVAMYGAQKKTDMSLKMKIALFAASVGGNVIPDIDLQWAAKGNTSYLLSHRGITHSFAMAPVWAAMFALLCYLILKVKDKRIFFIALAGVLLHIISDWSNAWGTGLLEPFSPRRFASGFIPNRGYIFWAFAGAAAVIGILYLLMRKKEVLMRTARTFWILSAAYVLFQAGHSAYVYFDLKSEGYERVAIRADRTPGGMSYFAKKEGIVIEGRSDLGGGVNGIVRTHHTDLVDLEALKKDSRARAILLFAPFVATQDLGDSIRVFDPRFSGRVGLLEVIVPKGS